MASNNNDKIIRQLALYIYICSTTFHGPDEIMNDFHIKRRMLQRDLKDLRDAGIIGLRYDKKTDNYVEDKKKAEFDEAAAGRHRQHLIRLRRLCILYDRLPRAPIYDIEKYESEYQKYLDYKEYMKEDPETFPPEYLCDPPEKPVWEDIKAAYYELCPGSNERMRQRDFEALNDAGLDIHYDRRYKNFIVNDYSDQ